MVSNSTFAKLILMSPAITRPLSSTRSRMSTRPCVRVGFTNSGNHCSSRVHRAPTVLATASLPQPTQGTKVDVQVLVSQPEDRLQLVHALVQLEQRQTQSFDFRVRQGAAVHAANGLMLQYLA